MSSFFIWLLIFIAYFGLPLASTLWFMYCYSGYKNALPFTEEKDRKKTNTIISAIIAGVFDTVFFVILFHYAFTCFFDFG